MFSAALQRPRLRHPDDWPARSVLEHRDRRQQVTAVQRRVVFQRRRTGAAPCVLRRRAGSRHCQNFAWTENITQIVPRRRRRSSRIRSRPSSSPHRARRLCRHVKVIPTRRTLFKTSTGFEVRFFMPISERSVSSGSAPTTPPDMNPHDELRGRRSSPSDCSTVHKDDVVGSTLKKARNPEPGTRNQGCTTTISESRLLGDLADVRILTQSVPAPLTLPVMDPPCERDRCSGPPGS